jgi:hypothetical protein
MPWHCSLTCQLLQTLQQIRWHDTRSAVKLQPKHASLIWGLFLPDILTFGLFDLIYGLRAALSPLWTSHVHKQRRFLSRYTTEKFTFPRLEKDINKHRNPLLI